MIYPQILSLLCHRRMLGLTLVGLCAGVSLSHAETIGNTLIDRGTQDGNPPMVLFNQEPTGTVWNAANDGLGSFAITEAGTITGAGIYAGTGGTPDVTPINIDLSFVLLRPTSTPDVYSVVSRFDVNTASTVGVHTYDFGANDWTVQAGDVLASWGTGPSYGNNVPGGYGLAYTSNVYVDAGNPKTYNAPQPQVNTDISFADDSTDYGVYGPRNYSVDFEFTAAAAPTPEPSTWALVILGGAGLVYFRRRGLVFGKR